VVVLVDEVVLHCTNYARQLKMPILVALESTGRAEAKSWSKLE